ncbi:nuclease HARBI1 [Paramuricea clavata]|uniref:Nuclease HARBI1 n=1 Tax=Paramuricea clavata TaxID=317549 RepID=A0A7D9I445_PARCT|nr:nuclease HARBI1 [Paramuricea clavata]
MRQNRYSLGELHMCHDATGDEESEAVMQMIKKVMTCFQELLLTLAELKLPIVQPRWCDLTDAGPGVGVSNFEVKFRDAELCRIFNSDHRIHVHHSRGDSGQNEAERTNSAIGDVVVDGATIEWEKFKRFESLSEEEIEALSYYSDSDLRARYHFGREAIVNIVRLIEEKIRPATNRSFPIWATNQVLITLRFLATGSFLQVTGDTIAGADKSTVSHIVHRVTLAIARKLDDFVKFPGTQHEKALIKQGFYDLGGKFLNVVAKWPGATHDSHIFRTSAIGLALEGATLDDGVLLGDSGYPCLPYLMTPYNNPITVQQRRLIEHKNAQDLRLKELLAS